MIHDENRFEDVDSPARPQGEPQASDLELTQVTHYAYDPQTYEILCRPGQRLSPKKARRLRELKLYAHVVKVAEKHAPETISYKLSTLTICQEWT